MPEIAYVLVNFGGPRSLDEIPSFLTSLLTDRDVIRTNLPRLLHRLLFSRIAKKRVKTVERDYEEMGGKSPIFDDTEALAKQLSCQIGAPVITFHRYLDATHENFKKKISALTASEIRVLPLFPQFTYATTGSCARFFEEHLPWNVVTRLRWVRSYPDHPAFIAPFVRQIKKTLKLNGLKEEETFLFFSAHGVPLSFIASGDLYLDECKQSYQAVMKSFPESSSLLAFQSQFGKKEWIKPYTQELVKDVAPWIDGRKNLLFLPISFTSDHVETIQEVGKGYLPKVEQQGIKAFRVPALGLDPEWIQGCQELLQSSFLSNNQMLIRRLGCKSLCFSCRKLCSK
jgi:ferrochelatase